MAIAPELPSHDIARFQWRNRFQYFHFFVANAFTIGADRWLHRDVAQHLEKMILDHIADGAGLIIEGASPLNTEFFRHRDLHALDVSCDSRKAP